MVSEPPVLVFKPQSQDTPFSHSQGKARGKGNEEAVGSCHFS